MSGKSIIQFDRKRRLLLEAARRGMPKSHAAALAGVSRSALHAVLLKGEQQKSGKYNQFYLEYQQAEAEGVKELMGKIEKAADNNWTSAAWLLERRFPKDFGRPAIQESIAQAELKKEEEKSRIVIYIPDNGRD